MESSPPTRSLVLWFPDWPVTALLRDGSDEALAALDGAQPIAVLERNLVVACSRSARAEGVRRGQRRRDAQARCPSLVIVPSDAARDHRVFAPVVAVVEERAPGVQIIRPGLCALRARGPARYYGGEAEAARVLLEALAGQGLTDVRAGIADGPFTAEQAARRADPVRIIPVAGADAFLAPLPVTVLGDAALSAGPELIELLGQLGVQTLGDFAALEAERVRERFGERGIRLHALAAGRDSRPVDPRIPPPELQREVVFEPPLEIADQVAFGIRVPADEFIDRLAVERLVCTELRVQLWGEEGERSERVWLHPASFDAGAVVDRVRWQLGEAQTEGGLRSGVVRVLLEPAAVDEASHHTPAIFGAGPEERVHNALSRVQAMLGHRGVVTSAIGGGRWLSERQVLVPWGDRVVLAKERARPWPGSLPDPLPTTVFPDPRAVEVTALGGAPVAVDERGTLTAEPAVLTESGRRREVVAWAGPWPVVERGWDAVRRRRAHRFQLVDADQIAWLVIWDDGWRAEARYD
ncbi:DNA polymerase Y family protein [Microbacterium sp. Root61]|uniref:DNA polymerase Y family protein n=1 Tax=Microbacterium sp. Root61 TaxID=1736570 RepID=UPI000B194DEE|nr:DNA polymerase Y family protein [Microbacterium sp. Root61]